MFVCLRASVLCRCSWLLLLVLQVFGCSGRLVCLFHFVLCSHLCGCRFVCLCLCLFVSSVAC